MTLDRLPDELKSGRVLVATAAQENAGLYTFPGLDDDYRIVTRAGTITKGDGEGVPQPPSGQWTWITNATGERIADGAEPDEQTDDASLLSKPPSLTPRDEAATPKKREDGKEHDCVDCEVPTRTLPHCHTTEHPVRYVCCSCMTKRGYDCSLDATA